MRKIFGALRRATLTAVDAIMRLRSAPALDPRMYQPMLPVPSGYTKELILDALCTVSIDGSASGELRGYAIGDCERFLHTLDLVPDQHGELLEIGGNPYFTTLLLRRFRPGYRLNITNYFGGPSGTATQRVDFAGFDGVADTCIFTYHSLNIEAWTFPFAAEQMDVIVYGEVLEHLTNDPMHAMREISRVLKPGGLLVLTTPNAARIENVVAFVEGRNVYDQYSGYGPYGRHNREYTRDELHRLLTYCGFEAEVGYTANVHPDIPASRADMTALAAALRPIRHREHDLGQYIFTRWRKTGECGTQRPSWLYRSYAAHELGN